MKEHKMKYTENQFDNKLNAVEHSVFVWYGLYGKIAFVIFYAYDEPCVQITNVSVCVCEASKSILFFFFHFVHMPSRRMFASSKRNSRCCLHISLLHKYIWSHFVFVFIMFLIYTSHLLSVWLCFSLFGDHGALVFGIKMNPKRMIKSIKLSACL